MNDDNKVAEDDNEEAETVLTTDQARGGQEEGVVRYVLFYSLALAVIAGVILYLVFIHQTR